MASKPAGTDGRCSKRTAVATGVTKQPSRAHVPTVIVFTIHALPTAIDVGTGEGGGGAGRTKHLKFLAGGS